MIRPIVAGNWKMNKTLKEAGVFVEEFRKLLLKINDTDVIFCPPFTALFGMEEILNDSPAFLGAQNCHWENSGALTGEVSVEMLLALGVDYVILGHSERRHIFGESDEWINKKVISATAGGLRPILCVGETLEERKQDKTYDVLRTQLNNGLDGMLDAKHLVVAYEPVWAIGTGLTANQEQILDAHQYVKNELESIFGIEQAENIPVLYGGSVKPGNTAELYQVDGVNGFLIGGASLGINDFFEIINKVNNLQRGV